MTTPPNVVALAFGIAELAFAVAVVRSPLLRRLGRDYPLTAYSAACVLFAGALVPSSSTALLFTGTVLCLASLLWRTLGPLVYISGARTWMRRRLEYGPVLGPALPALLVTVAGALLVAPHVLTFLVGLVALASVDWRLFRPLPLRFGVGPWILPALLILVLVAVVTGELTWVTKPDAAELLPALIAIQLTLAVIPLTVASVASQILATSLGLRSQRAVPWRWILFALVLSAISMSVDVVLMTRARSSMDVELAEVLGLLIVLCSVLVGILLQFRLRPEYIVSTLVKHLDPTWFEGRLYAHGPSRFQQRSVSDPLLPLESALRAFLRDNESLLFRFGLERLARRVVLLRERQAQRARGHYRRTPAAVEVALDRYFAIEFHALIEDAARRRMGSALEALTEFRRMLGPDSDDKAAARLENEGFGSAPGGVMFIGRVVDASIENDRLQQAGGAMHVASWYVERVVNQLPDPRGLNLDYKEQVPYSESSEEAREVHAALESFIWTVGDWGKQRDGQVAAGAAGVLSRMVRQAFDLSDPRWVQWLTHSALMGMYTLAELASKRGTFAMPVPSLFETVDPTKETHRRWVQTVSRLYAAFLPELAGVIGWYDVVQVAMLALQFGPAFVDEAATLAATLDDIGERQPVEKERKTVTKEVRQRVVQIRDSYGGQHDAFDKVFTELRGHPPLTDTPS